MRVLVCGAQGQVARALQECGTSSPHDIICLGRPELDITNPELVQDVFLNGNFDTVINAAAYTAVDLAETQQDEANAVNSHGAAILAKCANAFGCPIIHLSTDYVYDGASSTPYTEAMNVAPLGVYGRSKLQGEMSVKNSNAKHLILRTAWVYSPFGKNFVKTMLRLAEDRDEVSVVADQVGSPTYAIDIASSLLQLVDHISSRTVSEIEWGIYHLAGNGYAAWADVAEAVFQASGDLGGPTAAVKRISSAEYPTPVKRPSNSRLDTSKLYNNFKIRLPNWQDSVRRCVVRLRDEVE